MRRDRARIGGALLVGVALALPLGFALGRWGNGTETARPAAAGDAAVRDVFSPSIRSDPYFLEQQSEGVAALERYCEQTGESCAEARAARRRLAELGVPD